jgi:hypothetical protein
MSQNADEQIQNRLSEGECILLRGRLTDPSPSMDQVTESSPQPVLEDIIVKGSERVYRFKAVLPADH